MRMNVFEMEGFLRGRCVPRDLKVNETDAEYLVRKFDALEAKCAAQENKVIPVSTELPPANESVLLFDANGEGWLIGWRSLWYTWGQKETGLAGVLSGTPGDKKKPENGSGHFRSGTLKTSISLTGQ